MLKLLRLLGHNAAGTDFGDCVRMPLAASRIVPSGPLDEDEGAPDPVEGGRAEWRREGQDSLC